MRRERVAFSLRLMGIIILFRLQLLTGLPASEQNADPVGGEECAELKNRVAVAGEV